MIFFFQLKFCVKCFPNLFKRFKLKMMVVEQKMTQPVELNEKSVDLFSSIGQNLQKNLSLFQNIES